MPGIDQQFVHKHKKENVFIQDVFQKSEHVFKAVSRDNSDHPVYGDPLSGLSNSTYLVEAGRQANMAICHKFYGVGFEAKFMVVHIEWAFLEARPFWPGAQGPWEIDITFAPPRVFKGRTWLRTDSVISRAGQVFLKGKARFFLVDGNEPAGPGAVCPKAAMGAPVDCLDHPDQPGYRDELPPGLRGNLLIGPPATGPDKDRLYFQMWVDPDHFYFFEHPRSHIPGMMLLEAGKQCALCTAQKIHPHLAGSQGDLVAGQVVFRKLAALDQKTELRARAETVPTVANSPLVSVSVGFYQNETHLGSLEGRVAFAG